MCVSTYVRIHICMYRLCIYIYIYISPTSTNGAYINQFLLPTDNARTQIQDPKHYGGPKLAYTDQYSAVSAVERWRVPRSTTTLTWIDGAISRLFTTVADGLCSRDQLQKLQKRFQPAMHIESTGNASHMWSAQTTMSFLQFLSTES